MTEQREVGTAVAAALPWLMRYPHDRVLPLLDWPAICCLAVASAGVAHLAAPGRRNTAWSLALALLAVVALGQRGLTLLDYATAAPPAERPTLLALGGLEAGAVLLVGIPLALLAGRALRRLPAVHQ
jgi:hypothetical protein